mmetsp:Transcript_30573/g.74601  ORF Transcript_30573/g.74601 Transcript_30573/m.74601 type:complete len:203 (+) Transcript_30573:2-610(+)
MLSGTKQSVPKPAEKSSGQVLPVPKPCPGPSVLRRPGVSSALPVSRNSLNGFSSKKEFLMNNAEGQEAALGGFHPKKSRSMGAALDEETNFADDVTKSADREDKQPLQKEDWELVEVESMKQEESLEIEVELEDSRENPKFPEIESSSVSAATISCKSESSSEETEAVSDSDVRMADLSHDMFSVTAAEFLKKRLAKFLASN